VADFVDDLTKTNALHKSEKRNNKMRIGNREIKNVINNKKTNSNKCTCIV